MTLKNWKLAALALAAVGATACGGGSDNNDSSAPTFTNGTVTSAGGALTVNGVDWQVGSASLRVDDSTTPVTGEDNIKSRVREGSVVRIRGSSNGTSGVATEIEFRSVIEGPVGTKGQDTFTIAGATIAVDTSTRFLDAAGNASSYAAVAAGVPVEVSGLPESGNVLNATLVRLKNSGQPEYEAKGIVRDLAGSNFALTFASGGTAFLTVNASSAAGGIPAGVQNGSFVEVRGLTLTAGPTPPPTLTATLVEIEDRLFGSASNRAEVEGIVTNLSGTSFVVNGQQVTLASGAQFVGSINGQADLANGVKVEAEGSLDGSGVLVANKIKFKDGVRIQAVAAGTTGAVTMLGLSVVTDPARTQAEATLAPGQLLEVRGTPLLGGNRIFAQRVRAGGGSGDRPFVQGVVTDKNIGAPSVTILGITINTGGAEYRSTTDAPLTATAFYNAIVNGQTLVKVRFDQGTNSTSAPVDEAEIESEDD
jgi:hypothetical protein